MFAGNASRKRKFTSGLTTSLKKAKIGVVSSRSKSLTSKVNNLLKKQELKFRDNFPASANCLVAGTNQTLTGLVAQGDDAVARDGRRITMKYLHIHGLINHTANQGVRLLVYLDKQANGAVPSISDIVTAGAATSADSMLNFVNRDRFKILFDSYSGKGAVSHESATAGTVTHYYDNYINLRDVEAVYASNTTAEAITNNLGYVVWGPTTAAYTLNTRLVFTDA